MNLYLTGNFTLAPLKPFLRGHQVRVGDFNDYKTVLLGGRREALEGCGAVVCLLDGVEVAAELGFDEHAIASVLDGYAEACAAFAASHPDILLVASTVRLPAHGPASFSDTIADAGFPALEASLHRRLAALAAERRNVVVFDLARLIGQVGERAAYAPAMRYAARFGFAPAFAREVGTALDQVLRAGLQQSRKVLVLDFDNTLWGGVVGEVGAHGIAVSQDGIGRAFRHFQMAVQRLARRGILLVGLTKNNEADVDEVFSDNDMMVLRKDDFVRICANWEVKASNLMEVAKGLNLGLDSFVLIDDNPVERSAMREMLPMVAVPEFPASPELLPTWFLESVVPEYFPAYRITQEDRAKAEQYKANLKRAEMQGAISLDEFIANLDIRLDFRVNDQRDIVRVSQMTQKTNQFNLTTRRYSVADIEGLLARGDHDIVSMSYEDKFGKEGVVGLAILDGTAGEIDTFLLSCRVIGRTVEDQLLRKVEERAAARGHHEIRAAFRPTPKNQVAQSFLPSQGFVPQGDASSDIHLYRKPINAR
ncbi:HAD-IIIC family phosphatase [Salinarimonas soli]|uniref:HAD-IIIC family phosphatase n=1 Tax=Salinarimonas soli TaxID=1638099 RepID=A0A5B2W1Q6_9HYPH|nr:HAD-IIIC family phosphatase [Salinarimonas soli]KAA2244397.1 HAD-IIIC family phosphatase [Salinarimonas soli]